MTARILVVDDVEPNVKLLEKKLTDEYFIVLTAANGPDALALAERELPDLILLDVLMPGMDGFEVCRRLKANPTTTHIPIVMVTSLTAPEDRMRGLDFGADDFLVKPVRDIELYARVRSLARLKMAMDELRNREATDSLFGSHADADADGSASLGPIMLVDQNNAQLEIIRSALDGEGFVQPVTIGDAEARIQSSACELILINLTTSGADGLRLISHIRTHKDTRPLPVLALVDMEDHHPLVKAFELGANDCVKLPIDVLELKARVRALTRRKRIADRLRENLHLSMRLATTDSLTGLYNRHYLSSHLRTLVARARDLDRPLSVAMIDIDYFKEVNDRYGHAVGDAVLRCFAERLVENIRGVDLAARYGGEEFVVVMPDTDLDAARQIGDRIRNLIAEAPFETGTKRAMAQITVSVGIATLSAQDPDGMTVLARADDALYRAKNAGRNRIEVDTARTAAA
jgi:two-component system, cell cycle response regulator